MNKVKVVGCGGIASWLLPPLCQYLNYTLREGCEVSLIDGDVYEERNKERQRFHRSGNKAEVTAESFRAEYPNIFFWPHPAFVTNENIVQLVRDGDVVFSCVDNHATRLLLSERAEELDNILFISGGNDFTDGNIQVHYKRNGKDLTMPVANKYHPEITQPKDKNPGDEPVVHHMSCQELQVVAPQLIFTNNRIAAEMLACYYVVMMGKLKYDEVYIDLMTGNTQPKKDGQRVQLLDPNKITFED